MPRELFGWVSPRRRTLHLAAGWVLISIALATIAIGLITGAALMLIAGLAAGIAAWSLSASLPDPSPAPHAAERKRREAISRFSDHPVIVAKSGSRPH